MSGRFIIGAASLASILTAAGAMATSGFQYWLKIIGIGIGALVAVTIATMTAVRASPTWLTYYDLRVDLEQIGWQAQGDPEIRMDHIRDSGQRGCPPSLDTLCSRGHRPFSEPARNLVGEPRPPTALVAISARSPTPLRYRSIARHRLSIALPSVLSADLNSGPLQSTFDCKNPDPRESRQLA